MTKFSIICSVVLFIVGLSFCFWKLNSQDAKYDTKRDVVHGLPEAGTLVYAARDVAAGEIIVREDLQEKQVPQEKIPGSALGNAASAIGLKLKYGITKGEPVSMFDFEKPPWDDPVPVVYTVRDIADGQIVQPEDVEVVIVGAHLAPRNNLESTESIVGRKAKSKISQRTAVTLEDFE